MPWMHDYSFQCKVSDQTLRERGGGGGGLLYEKIGYDCQEIEIKTPQRRLIWAWLKHYLIPKRYNLIPEDIHTFQIDGTFS